ncbi:helix-turn-helix domain-containing protein [Streptomyces sp. NPDC015171]|uniref:helix-turn-helix domain-containing protein n=1 Tax=Streptomyces sp. NPDC015171 TaxID=3364945 RepID=UPI0036F6C3F4
MSAAENADLLLVPALAERRPDALLAHVSGPDSAAVRRLVAGARERGTPVASAGTGTFLLAESGVLDGRHATTSWWLAPRFRRRHPAVTVAALAQTDPVLAAFEHWARAHLDQPLSIAEGARAVGVSERTLQRAVRRTLGTSPVGFVRDLRVERAAHLPRTTGLPLETIARKVGYEHANTLRILLRERTGERACALRRR